MIDRLSPEVVEPLLRGRFGRPYLYVDSCESTQNVLEPDMPEGTTAVCDFQSAGRGRLGRSWVAPAGTAIHLSVLLRPPAERRVAELSLVGATAAADAIEEEIELAVQIKWPNDVMVRRTKVAGVLGEVREGAVVLGIGINVNQTRDELPADARQQPGSLRTVDGRVHARAPLLASLLESLERSYDAWLGGGLAALYVSIGARDFLRGRRVTVNGTSGTALMIDREGRLQVDVGHCEPVTLESGEVEYER